MAQLKITAVEGLRTESPDTWKDFYSDEDKPQQSNEKTETEAEAELETESAAYKDDFEEEEEHSSTNVNQNTEETPCLRYSSTEHLDKVGNIDNKQKKKGKSKRPRTHSDTKPPPLNLYQNHIRDQLNHSRRGRAQPQDTMSDQGVARRRGRKLNRRAQMKKYHSMEQAVEQAGRERLEQKFMELEELLHKPLVAGRRPTSASRVEKMVNLHHMHGDMGHREIASSRSRVGAWMEGTVQEEEDYQDESQAYSAIRVLQTVGPDKHVTHAKNITYHSSASSSEAHQHHHRPSPRQSRLATKPPIPGRRKKGSVETSPTSSSGGSQHRKEGDRKESGPRHYNFSSDDEESVKHSSNDVSPQRTDMHLKNSDNPKLKEWLKRKDTEYRRTRKAERTRKREERNDKMIEQELKIARREKSAERVKQWMETKRKEALRRQKEVRRRMKQEAEAQAKLKAKSPCGDGVSGSRVERPQSAPSRPVKKYIPVQRPDSAVEARSKLDTGDGSAPKPPNTKFVYKRPVSGRVRLMKMQNIMKANEREAEQKRVEELSAEEKEQRARTSYDAWLIAKRKEDIEKRKAAKRQKELTKSDPEMESIIPELARRRIDRIKNGKKSIDTGMRQIDDDANARFGGGNFGEGQQPRAEEGQDQPVTPGHPSYKLEVTGEGASLLEFNTRARPATAKARMPIPQKAFSPRRPQSAKVSRSPSPKVRTVMDVDHSKEPNPFSLPFPESKGCPDHVRRVQERIFSTELTSQSGNESQRPEPQGCDSGETVSCPKGVDESQSSKSEPRTSMVLLQELEAAALEEAQQSFVETVKNLAGKQSVQASAPEQAVDDRASSPDEPPAAESTSPEQVPADEISPEEAAADEPLTQVSEQTTEAEDAAEGEDDDELEQEPVQEEEGDEDAENTKEEDEEKVEDEEQGKDASDGCSEADPDQQKPESPVEDEQMIDAAVENQAEPEKELEHEHEEEQNPEDDTANKDVDEQNDPHPEDNKDLQPTEESQAKDEETGVDDTPRRLGKHVSFSEDLTVFEAVSTDASSNFEDERGDDGDDDYKCLDDMPDP